MQEAPPRSRHKLYGGIAVSVALHVIIAVALFVRLPAPDPTTPKEETVSVEIVPPPEEQQPEEQKPEDKPQEQALNLKMPEEKPEEEKQPPAPPPEPPKQEAEKAGAKPPEQAATEQEKPAEEKAEAAPPPPPPLPQKPEEKAKAEQPPPPPPAAPEPAKEETPPPPPPAEEKADKQQSPPPSEQAPSQQPPADAAADEPAQGRPLPALRPVFAFGDEDKGSKVSPDGNASEEGEVAKADEAEAADTADSPEDLSEEAGSETDADVAKDTDPAAPALPQTVAPPVLSAANADALASSDKGGTSGIQAEISSQPPAGAAKSEKPVTDKKAAAKPLKEAKRLFSLRDTSDDVATTAMGSVPRSARAGQLCATELREQLRHGSPAYQPEILPSYGLPQGNVLDIRNAAFRADSQWFDVRFRCEIDENATKVVSFGVEVGNAVPRSQWKARRFPEY